jgi:hypothetical protein
LLLFLFKTVSPGEGELCCLLNRRMDHLFMIFVGKLQIILDINKIMRNQSR